MRKIKKMRNDSCRKRTVTTVTVTEMGMKSTKQLYCKKKGLYTLLSRCIDPWNNREVWVDKYCQILYSPIWLRSYFIQ